MKTNLRVRRFNAKGEKTHLFNGVCSAASCPNGPSCVDCKMANWDFTLVQPFDLDPPPPPPPAPCISHVAGWTCTTGVCVGVDGNCGGNIGEPALACPVGDTPRCAAAAATVCDATSGCTAFALSPAWKSEQAAKLFSAAAPLTPNADWTVWQKSNSTKPIGD